MMMANMNQIGERDIGERYRCPLCGGSLNTAPISNVICCANCHAKFPWRDGIPVFSKDPKYYWGEISQELMTELVERSRAVGYSAAFSALLPQMPKDWGEYLVQYAHDERRAAWQFLLQLPPGGSVLDLGCGWGNLAMSLAHQFGCVYAMDLTYERTAIAKLRAQSVGLHNVVPVVGGDTPRLPFPAESLDVVVLNGVLEWIPYSIPGDPRDVQLAQLREIRRVLKPTGQIYIGIENRVYWRYFCGDVDPHTKLAYITLLPRRLADWYCNRATQRPFRAYTYTWRGYRRLLNQAGFSNAKFYLPHPDYREFTHLIDLASAKNIGYALRPNTFKGRLGLAICRRVNLMREAGSSFGIVGSKTAPGTSWYERFLCHIAKSEGFARLSMTRLLISGRGAMLIFGADETGEERVSGRVPLSFGAKSALPNFAMALGYLSHLHALPNGAQDLIPKLIAEGEFEGTPYIAQRALPGRPVVSLPIRKLCTQMHPVLIASTRFLIDLHCATRITGSGTNPSPLRWLDRFSTELPERVPESAAAILEAIATALSVVQRQDFPRVCCHGDYCLDNIMVSASDLRITGMIDWECCEISGLPVLDLITMMASWHHERENLPIVEAFRSVLTRLGEPSFERDLLRAYCRELELTAAVVHACLFLSWPHFLWRKLAIGDPFYGQYLSVLYQELQATDQLAVRALGGL